jgi:hypothetical protein
MAKGNRTIYLSAEREDSDFNSETEKCLKLTTSKPSRKVRCVLISAFLVIFAFIVGFVIGLFTRNELWTNNAVNHRGNGDHNKNLQTLLNHLDTEELRRNSR